MAKESVELRQTRRVLATLCKQHDKAMALVKKARESLTLCQQDADAIVSRMRKVHAAIRAMEPATTWIDSRMRPSATGDEGPLTEDVNITPEGE